MENLAENSYNIDTLNAEETNGIWIEDEDGNRQCVCPVSVEIIAIEVDRERDRYWYVAQIGEPINREVRSPVHEGGLGIARAVAMAGVWTNAKKLGAYFDEILAARWRELIQNIRSYEEGETGIDPEAISVYEKFCEWVAVNRKEFDEGFWGHLDESGNEETKVIVYVAAFAKFFADIRIKNEAERQAVLRYWKKKNWLLPGNDGKFSVVHRDPLMRKARRAYIVVIPEDKLGES
ncbi:hypothetical protein MTAT_28020 [Moorella thermoacetica]|uniref:Uncharacterized protein n=1 Tax=Neomoorella thermoacetica TaxID=1525 RepID=A0AAC9MU01_NEOTH|nr:hypothetical protein [Moorella thermoacetica]AOQ22996.1 hypothetical protein Maut_00527 [Moorella thermoacetica]TYL07938.1 hypothetical protein MTAT_28020 [Moorella thermoacetica]